MELMAKCLNLGFSVGAPSWDAAGRLVEHFQNAGLARPNLFAEMPVGGGEDSQLTVGWRGLFVVSCQSFWSKAVSRRRKYP